VRIEIDLDAVPVAPGVAGVAAQLGLEAWEPAVAGGEDFELCACLPAHVRAPGTTRVGSVVGEGGGGEVTFSSGGARREPAGYEHRVG
jgi:thiamine-monophosphate kinase